MPEGGSNDEQDEDDIPADPAEQRRPGCRAVIVGFTDPDRIFIGVRSCG